MNRQILRYYNTTATTTATVLRPFIRDYPVSRYQKKHSPTHLSWSSTFISFFHLLRSIASSLFNLHAWQSFCTAFVQVLFGLPLGLEPSTSYSIHFFTQNKLKRWIRFWLPGNISRMSLLSVYQTLDQCHCLGGLKGSSPVFLSVQLHLACCLSEWLHK